LLKSGVFRTQPARKLAQVWCLIVFPPQAAVVSSCSPQTKRKIAMPASPEVEELVRDVDLLKAVVSVLVEEADDSLVDRLLVLYPDGTDMKERLVSLLDLPL
jgi:hypothetical protein